MRAHQTEHQEIAERALFEFNQHGTVKSEDLRRLFKQNAVKPADRALREEIVFMLYDLLGRKLSDVSRATGMSVQKVLRLIELRTKRLHESPEAAQREIEREEELEERRFSGRVALIDACYQGAQEALKQAVEQIPDMTGPQAARAAEIFLKMAERTTDLVQDRKPEAGERLLDDEALEAKNKEYQERQKKLELVIGSDTKTA